VSDFWWFLSEVEQNIFTRPAPRLPGKPSVETPRRLWSGNTVLFITESPVHISSDVCALYVWAVFSFCLLSVTFACAAYPSLCLYRHALCSPHLVFPRTLNLIRKVPRSLNSAVWRLLCNPLIHPFPPVVQQVPSLSLCFCAVRQ
jgi:hypothetical protein